MLRCYPGAIEETKRKLTLGREHDELKAFIGTVLKEVCLRLHEYHSP